jgi:hypothetical protein
MYASSSGHGSPELARCMSIAALYIDIDELIRRVLAEHILFQSAATCVPIHMYILSRGARIYIYMCVCVCILDEK